MEETFEIVVDELDEDTCWRLLARARFGRVGFREGAGVVVLPVNAATSARRIVVRTDRKTTIAEAVGTLVAFEADHIDDAAESGWSVLVRGRLVEVADPGQVDELRRTQLRAWAPLPRDHWMLIEPLEVTGRMIHRHRNLRPGNHVPYMPPD